MTNKIEHSDMIVLRELARRQLDIANDPVMDDRRRLWRLNNDRSGERPMILAETIDPMRTGELLEPEQFKCSDPFNRMIEAGFRSTIYCYESIRDDSVVDPWFNCMWVLDISDYGVEVKEEHSPNSPIAVHYVSPIKDLEKDFEKLRHRTFSINRQATLAKKELLENIFGDILPVRIHPIVWPLWTMGMTWDAIKLVGMENLMVWMYDNPSGVHRLMSFLRDDFISFVRWMEQENLLYLNNANDYIGSGGRGFTNDLPQRGFQEGASVRAKDMWVLLESQETTGISPAMFEEFIFPYQKEIADLFGLVYYGCCEPLEKRWPVIRQIGNLRSVSVSPWCDQAFMAEALGKDYVFSRKPNPVLISGDNYDPTALREDIRYTLRTARNCNLEIILKDVYSLNHQPERLGEWVRIAREEIMRIWQ